MRCITPFSVFFFQAECGIRAFHVTGVQTCALPISATLADPARMAGRHDITEAIRCRERAERSEEHTSELQSRENLVCRLLLEKKKKTTSALLFLKQNDLRMN